MVVINQKTLSEDISSGISGKDERPAATQVPEAEVWGSGSKACLEALWNSRYDVSCFTHFGLSMRNHYCILQTDIICCSDRKLICSLPQIDYLVRLTNLLMEILSSIFKFCWLLWLLALYFLTLPFLLYDATNFPAGTHHVQWLLQGCIQ